MLWQTFWYIISLFILTTTWENNGFCIFQGQMTCQVETMILCKNATCVTLNYLFLAHNTSKWSTWYVLYICVMYRALYKIFTLQHKMKKVRVVILAKFNKILNFKVSGSDNNYNLAPEINGECCDEHFGIL